MIEIDLGIQESYNSSTNEFSYEEGGIVRFEYTLRNLYDWEGRWEKPFLNGKLTHEEATDFYLLMALDPIDPKFLTTEIRDRLTEYISHTPTATTFSSTKRQNRSKQATPKVHTSEELYALMIQAGVPLEFENRNLNRLMDILKIISINNSPPKKMDKHEIYRQNQEINARRKAKINSKG